MESHQSLILFFHLPGSFPNLWKPWGCCWMQASPAYHEGLPFLCRWSWTQQRSICCLWNKPSKIMPRKRGHEWQKVQWGESPAVDSGCPSIGTENEVLVGNICIKEFGICKMLHLLLDILFFFLFIRGQLGFQCMSVAGWGSSIKFHGQLSFPPHLQYEILNFILIFSMH